MNTIVASPPTSPAGAAGRITIQYTVSNPRSNTVEEPKIMGFTTPSLTTGMLVDLLTYLDGLGFTGTESEGE